MTTITVRARYGDGDANWGPWSDYASVITGAQPFSTNMWSLSALSSPGGDLVEIGVEALPDPDPDETLVRVEYRLNSGEASDLGLLSPGEVVVTVPASALVSVQLRAAYSNGVSDWSDAKTATPAVGVGVPSAPVAPTLALQTGAWGVDVSLSAAPADGGSAILGYEVEWADANTYDPGADSYEWTVWPSDPIALPYATAALPNDLRHVFRVRARNAIGAGPWSPLSEIVTRPKLTQAFHQPVASSDLSVSDTPNIPLVRFFKASKFTQSSLAYVGGTEGDDGEAGGAVFPNTDGAGRIAPFAIGALHGALFDCGYEDYAFRVRWKFEGGQQANFIIAADGGDLADNFSGVVVTAEPSNSVESGRMIVVKDSVSINGATGAAMTDGDTQAMTITKAAPWFHIADVDSSTEMADPAAAGKGTDNNLLWNEIEVTKIGRNVSVSVSDGDIATIVMQGTIPEVFGVGLDEPFPHLDSTLVGVAFKAASSSSGTTGAWLTSIEVASPASAAAVGLPPVFIATSGVPEPLVPSYTDKEVYGAIVPDGADYLLVQNGVAKIDRKEVPANVGPICGAAFYPFVGGGPIDAGAQDKRGKAFKLVATIDFTDIPAPYLPLPGGAPLTLSVTRSNTLKRYTGITGDTGMVASKPFWVPAGGGTVTVELEFVAPLATTALYAAIELPGNAKFHEMWQYWTATTEAGMAVRLESLTLVDQDHESADLEWGEAAALPATQINMNGIIVRGFDAATSGAPRAMTYGRYADGDYWIVADPLTYIETSAPWVHGRFSGVAHQVMKDDPDNPGTEILDYEWRELVAFNGVDDGYVPGWYDGLNLDYHPLGAYIVGGNPLFRVFNYPKIVGPGSSSVIVPSQDAHGTFGKAQGADGLSGAAQLLDTTLNIDPGLSGQRVRLDTLGPLVKVGSSVNRWHGDAQQDLRTWRHDVFHIVAAPPAVGSFSPCLAVADQSVAFNWSDVDLTKIPLMPYPADVEETQKASLRGSLDRHLASASDYAHRNDSTQIGECCAGAGGPYGREQAQVEQQDILALVATPAADRDVAGKVAAGPRTLWQKCVARAVQRGHRELIGNALTTTEWAGGGAHKHGHFWPAFYALVCEPAANNSVQGTLREAMYASAANRAGMVDRYDARLDTAVDWDAADFLSALAAWRAAGKIFAWPVTLTHGWAPLNFCQQLSNGDSNDSGIYIENSSNYWDHSARRWDDIFPYMCGYNSPQFSNQRTGKPNNWGFATAQLSSQATMVAGASATVAARAVGWLSSYFLNNNGELLLTALVLRRMDGGLDLVAHDSWFAWNDKMYAMVRMGLVSDTSAGVGAIIQSDIDTYALPTQTPMSFLVAGELPSAAARAMWRDYRASSEPPINTWFGGVVQFGRLSKDAVYNNTWTKYYALYPGAETTWSLGTLRGDTPASIAAYDAATKFPPINKADGNDAALLPDYTGAPAGAVYDWYYEEVIGGSTGVPGLRKMAAGVEETYNAAFWEFGQGFSTPIVTSNDVTAYSLVSPPAGWTVDSATGVITKAASVPASSTTFDPYEKSIPPASMAAYEADRPWTELTLRATNANGSTDVNLRFRVA